MSVLSGWFRFRLGHCFPKIKHRISMYYDFVIRHSLNTNRLICVRVYWFCPPKCNQGTAICLCMHNCRNNCIFAGINIYEQISRKSDTCIYLMSTETQLTKMIITHAFQCYSGRINKHRYQRRPLWEIAIRSFWDILNRVRRCH